MAWVPYLVIMLLFVIWRVFFLELAGKDPNRPDLIYNLSTQPLATLLGFIQTILQDYLHIMAGAWAQTINPTKIDLTSSFFLFSLVIAVLGIVLTIFYLLKLEPAVSEAEKPDQHWITYALYFLSVGAMLQAIRSPRWFWPLTLNAWFACGLHLLTMEYFIGLELLRPVFLWIVIGQSQKLPRKRLLSVLKRWLPYLVVMLLCVI